MEDFYKQFTQEKQYVENVSEATLEAYKWAWKAFEPVLKGKDRICKKEVTERIARLRKRGLSPVSINTYLRSLNAFLKWAQTEGHDVGLTKITKLKEPCKILQIFRDSQVQKLVRFKPTNRAEQRTHTLTSLILDTGLRIDETLSLERSDVNLEDLHIIVGNGKGGKGRIVPISTQLRKILFRYMKQHQLERGDLLFFAVEGLKINQRNALRSFKAMCRKLGLNGVRCSFHPLRHTFATFYLRSGGGEFRLQRMLGHSTLEMTRRYVHLETEDLSSIHEEVSLLNKKRQK